MFYFDIEINAHLSSSFSLFINRKQLIQSLKLSHSCFSFNLVTCIAGITIKRDAGHKDNT
jgi:hypothetical protein